MKRTLGYINIKEPFFSLVYFYLTQKIGGELLKRKYCLIHNDKIICLFI